MILQLEDGEDRLDVEVVGAAGVVEVVNGGREENGEDLEVGQPGLGKG